MGEGERGEGEGGGGEREGAGGGGRGERGDAFKHNFSPQEFCPFPSQYQAGGIRTKRKSFHVAGILTAGSGALRARFLCV